MLFSDHELREEWKKAAKVRVTANGLVCPDPAFIFLIIVTPRDQKKTRAKIYDGHSGIEDFYIDARSDTQVTRQTHFNPPMYFNQGIYVTVDGDVESVVLHYLPVKE